ncbi:UNVERIFIED_CONTAM: Retrovirus-related Pol polyprotein from transposon TNT 1-94 [Sesamum radiatum]|uniref:Retrovirus-related Pol polyprotein from transposon TNT 1-94 n=1 Tax=Sesamum radiatum TaxID=300843 RepID=A0AAW2KKH6_SESRA
MGRVEDKLDSRSSFCRFIGYLKETAWYCFYDSSEQKVFVSRNGVSLEKGFPTDTRRDELLLEESSEAPQSNAGTLYAPTVSTDNVPILRRSPRVPQPRKRYGFLSVTGQLDNDSKTYGEAMSDIDSGKWLEAMKSEMDSMSSNQVWKLVDRPKGVKPIGYKWVYKRKIGADGEVTTFKARLVAKGYTQRSGVDFEETFLLVVMAKSIRIMFAIAAWDRSKRILEMTQNSYVENVWKRSKMEHSKRGFFPMRHRVKLSKKQTPKTDGELKRILDIPYASAVGSIQYVVQCTRPDIAYTLSVMSRYQACAGEAHYSAAKTILKYLRRTKNVFFVYGGGELILEGFSDASFQSDDDDAKSQLEFVFKLNGGVVAWKSFKQDTTANSTMEAEYIAASEAAKEAVWMKNYIQELGVVPSIAEPVVIFYYNNGAIAQAKELRSHYRSKHILRRYHLLREMVGRGDVRMDRVSLVENIKNPLTKPVSQVAHAQHLGKMGLRKMSDWL